MTTSVLTDEDREVLGGILSTPEGEAALYAISLQRERYRPSTDLSCSEWALQEIVPPDAPNGLTWEGREYLPGYYNEEGDPRDATRTTVCKKGSQLCFTVAEISKRMYGLKIRGCDIMYVLPTLPDAIDFSGARLNVIIEDSPSLSEFFTNVDNVGLKRAGRRSLYVRGSHSRSRLKSVPVEELVLDEYDDMDQNNVSNAIERLSGREDPRLSILSIPSVPGYGIDAEYEGSTKQTWRIPCPHCGHIQALEWDKHIKWDEDEWETARIECEGCEKSWDEEQRRWAIARGEWIAENPDSVVVGFHLSQLYSATVTIKSLVQIFLKVRTDGKKIQQFFNGRLGLAYVLAGSQVTLAVLRACEDAQLHTVEGWNEGGFVTLGCDVGAKILHVEIDKWDRAQNIKRTLWAGTIHEFDELDKLMERYNVNSAVVDTAPESRQARDFAERHRGKAWVGRITELKSDSLRWDDKKREVAIDRTDALDDTLGRFRKGRNPGGCILPAGLPDEWHDQLQAPKRIMEEDRFGRPIARYREEGSDHYAFAALFSEIASLRTPRTAASYINVDEQETVEVAPERENISDPGPLEGMPKSAEEYRILRKAAMVAQRDAGQAKDEDAEVAAGQRIDELDDLARENDWSYSR